MTVLKAKPQPMATPKGWLYGTLLLCNAMLSIPVYSILYYKIAYWTSIYYAWKSHNNYLLTAILAYSVYIILDPSPRQGGWKLPSSSSLQSWCNRCSCFRLMAEYFDTELIHEEDLDPQQSYIFVYHPHGIIGVGICSALATDGAGFDQHFPGLKRKSVTLNATFLTPIFREWILANGFISANKSTLVRTLAKNNPNGPESIVLLPGGAAEALLTERGSMTLHLKRRMGFVRLAMETNTALLPCLGFGENDVFDTLVTAATTTTTSCEPGHGSGSSTSSGSFSSSLRSLIANVHWRRLVGSMQRLFLKVTGVSPPIITNPFPRPVKMAVVVGKPVVMEENKTVEENHAVYVEALVQLYERHATKLGYGHVKLDIR